ncbi:aspartate/glutamate racemase family protein [Vibrio sp. 99-70-13A1]|uniref:aspartate/glutamate racemase family protein n=1 Tax=Vibrio sp. 99-70-13A1 TaxID=2607601 RepID=UPI0014935D0E|nr:aspartate/glutamate racemase family protein [Vibrio sp. 99-70-13A1]NOH97422.1 aspartate/glutamate racemase family protein [Vibrio sp. 99-70-13A1]
MKTIGMLGGMSWESTSNYYREINQLVKAQLGGFNSAKIVMYSVNFEEIEKLQSAGEWDKTGTILSDAALSLKAAGADFLMICTNTMHKVANQVEQDTGLPLLHIADATGEQLKAQGISKVGLLGTAFTMEQEFYKGRLQEKFGIEVIVPNGVQRKLVHEVIYNELVQGVLNNRSRNDFITVISDLQENGAEAVILGCTEIAMLVKQNDTRVPLFDTTEIHAQAAVHYALS